MGLDWSLKEGYSKHDSFQASTPASLPGFRKCPMEETAEISREEAFVVVLFLCLFFNVEYTESEVC